MTKRPTTRRYAPRTHQLQMPRSQSCTYEYVSGALAPDSMPRFATIAWYIAVYNAEKKLFAWVATADSVFSRVQHLASRINGTEH